LDKLYYSIGEVAELIGVPTSTLRYWDKAGALCPSKRQAGRRFYTQKDLDRATRLKELTGAGYTLAGAVKRIEREAAVAGEIIEELREILDAIKQLRRQI